MTAEVSMNNVKKDLESSPLEGRYANSFRVGYNAFEFLIDFGQVYNGGKQEQLHTRIVTSPFYAKELLEMLGGAIQQYEQTYGALQRE